MGSELQRSVFINCPFDKQYAPLLRAIVFAVVDCGFSPRCALEKSDAGEVRIQKIYRVIGECGLGIHDLSRTQLDDRTELPRFNMPLELGIFLGAKFLGTEQQLHKQCLIFDEQPLRYRMYLSDVAGQDIEWHDNDPKMLMRRIRDWLASVTTEHLPTGSFVWDHYGVFQAELRERCASLKQKTDELTYNDLLHHISSFREAYLEELEIKGAQKILNPADVDIKRAIRSIAITDDDPFLWLRKGANELSYMQAVMVAESAWRVEYQDGHLDRHFQSSTDLTTESVIELFVSYSNSEESWRTSVDWKPMEL